MTGCQALKKQGALPILMDEGVISPIDLEEFIKLGLLDGVAMKPARCGGLAYAPEGPGLGVEVDEAKVVELMKRSGGDKLFRT